MVKWLLEAGVDIKKRDRGCGYPLHVATNRSAPKLEMVKLLIESGADVNASGLRKKRTPLHLVM